MNKPKYRSGLEEAFGIKHKDFKFEPFDIPYVIKRKYKPDFVSGDVLIECKGFFRSGDTAKYKAIKQQIEGSYELIFILSNPTKKLRKGSKMNMGEWCDKEGIKYFTVNQTSELNNYLKER